MLQAHARAGFRVWGLGFRVWGLRWLTVLRALNEELREVVDTSRSAALKPDAPSRKSLNLRFLRSQESERLPGFKSYGIMGEDLGASTGPGMGLVCAASSSLAHLLHFGSLNLEQLVRPWFRSSVKEIFGLGHTVLGQFYMRRCSSCLVAHESFHHCHERDRCLSGDAYRCHCRVQTRTAMLLRDNVVQNKDMIP